jgi:hypothetical protein
MLPPSLAIAWTLWRRHRWGLLLVLGYVLAAGMVSIVLRWQDPTPQTAALVAGNAAIPLAFAVFYLVAVFSYGFEADLNARESCFPAGLLTLPVRTIALAGWPMVYGAAAAALLWLVVAAFLLRPGLGLLGLRVPLWWPAVLATAYLAWVQALLWLPFGLPWMRVIVSTIFFASLATVAQSAVTAGASEGTLAALFAGLTVTAWGVGLVGLRRARRGDVPNWGGLFTPLGLLARRQRRQPFASAAQAQAWFEWRRHGVSLPLATGMLLPFALLPLAFETHGAFPTANVVLGVLGVPVFMASLAGTTVSKSNPWVKDYYGVGPFTATRPMSTAGLVGAMLKMAARSTLIAWGLVIVAVLLAVILTGRLDEVAGWWRLGLREYHPVEIVAGLLAGIILLVAWTWKRLVDSLLVGLTGREWVIKGYLFGGMLGTISLWIIGLTHFAHPETHATVRAVLPWLLAGLILCRLLAAAWALRVGLQQGLLAGRTVATWAVAWLLLALALFAVVAWVVPADLVSRYYLAIGVVWCLPMTHLAATPLALAWNRHR